MTNSDIEHMAQGYPPSHIGKDHEEVVIELASSVIELQQKLDAANGETEKANRLIDDLREERNFLQRIAGERGNKLDALSAENAALKISVDTISRILRSADNNYCMCGDSMDSHQIAGCGSPTGMFDYHVEKWLGKSQETPATDAYLNLVRAEGADKVAEYHFVRIDALKEVSRQGHLFHKAAYSDAVSVANYLRSGTHDTADKAG